jgi:hypothetical protein
MSQSSTGTRDSGMLQSRQNVAAGTDAADSLALSTATALHQAGDLFPVSSLLDVVGRSQHAAFDAATRPPPASKVGDIRSQWQSIDAWTALQEGLLAQAAGVDGHMQQFELGLIMAVGSTPAAGSLHAQAPRIDSVASFKLAELA